MSRYIQLPLLLLAASLLHAGNENLIRLVFPGLEPKGETLTAGATVPIRSISEEGENEYEDDFTIEPSPTFQVLSGGKSYTAMLLVTNHNEMGDLLVLAAFDTSGKEPKLLDAIDVRQDRSCGLSPKSALQLNKGTTALALECYHHNSSQGYAAYSYIAFLDGKFVPVLQLWLLSSNGGCGGMFNESVEYVRMVPAPAEKFNRIAVSVKLEKHADEPAMECGKPVKASSTRYFRTTFRWDAKTNQFQPMTTGMDGLDAWNKDRY